MRHGKVLVGYALYLPALVVPFHCQWSLPSRRYGTVQAIRLTRIAVPAKDLEKDLSDAERTVVSIFRSNGAAVAYVTSILPLAAQSAPLQQRRRSTRSRNNNLPHGRPLGSGSAFCVNSRGYLVTNFHVIERAYRLQQMASMVQRIEDNVLGNLTALTGIDFNFNATSFRRLLPRPLALPSEGPQVFVRINSETRYQKARIVDVAPELDVAVLFVDDTNSSAPVSFPVVQFGSSRNLLVGQSLVAIGNPFGLDKTVTTGVVSALNREIRTDRSVRPIQNCIQTDCSINPGNSGGPLLNLQGDVVGVNTAIVTTSGSSAGIGFAVEADQVAPVVHRIIRQDVAARQATAWLGVAVINADSAAGEANNSTASSILLSKNWIAKISPGSPAARANMQALQVYEQDASLKAGDAIVAVGGNNVTSYAELLDDFQRRRPGEQVQITLENIRGERRVEYLQLAALPRR